MELIGNGLNGSFFATLVKRADSTDLEQIRLAVAYVTKLDDLFDLADRRKVPLTLYALADGNFPSLPVIRRFVESQRTSWQLFLTRNFYHPKILWFRGVGAYIGSANLTDNGWFGNLECGIWLDQQDLLRLGWEQNLSSMFDVIAARSTAASVEHVQAFQRLQAVGKGLDRERASFDAAAKKELSGIAGGDTPLDPTALRGGGAAKTAFLSQWHGGLTILRKIAEMLGTMKKPSWVSASVPNSIVQDQATEGWYHDGIRSSGESLEQIERFHRQNLSSPEEATRAILDHWVTTADQKRWERHVNDNPMEVHRLLERHRLSSMDKEGLSRILFLVHASREHARQIRNEALGLPHDAKTVLEDRCGLYADLLLRSRSENGKTIHDLLDYVLWDESRTKDCAERIWNAVNLPEWSLPHVGVNTLGEMIGYARPSEYPPRNGRVSKTLYALGYEGISW